MAEFLDIFLLVIMIILLITAGVFATKSAVAVKNINNYSSDADLQNAHRNLTGASIGAWVGVALIIIIIGLYLYFASETAGVTGGFFALGLLIFTMLLVLLVGVLSILAARDIGKSSNYAGSGSSAHRDAVIAASVSIGGLGLMLIILIFIIVSVHRRRQTLSQTAIPVNPTPGQQIGLPQQQSPVLQQSSILQQLPTPQQQQSMISPSTMVKRV